MNFRQNDYHKYESAIRQAELRYQIPPNMLAALLYQASQFDPDRIAGKGFNPVGVIGIAKISREDCRYFPSGADLRTDPRASIICAARILRSHFARFGNWRDAVAAYHSKPDIVAAHKHGREKMPIDIARYLGEIETVVALAA